MNQPTGRMEGQGAYDRHSLAQHSAGGFGIPLLERALAELVVPPEGRSPLLVADYGAAGGRNELGPMSVAVGTAQPARPGPLGLKAR